MTAISFDTLKLTRRLEEAGLDRKQAEALAEALAEAIDSGAQDLATKHDITMLESKLGRKIEILEERTEGRFTLLQWMIGINLAVSLGTLWLVIKLLSA